MVIACANEVQTCRQVAAVSTGISYEVPDVMFSIWREPQATEVCLRATGNREQKQRPAQRSWTLVPCSVTVPRDVYPNLSKATARLTRHEHVRASDVSVSWEEYARRAKKISRQIWHHSEFSIHSDGKLEKKKIRSWLERRFCDDR